MGKTRYKRGVIPVPPEFLRGFSSSGINTYVDVIMLRIAEEGKLRLPPRYPLRSPHQWPWSSFRFYDRNDASVLTMDRLA